VTNAQRKALSRMAEMNSASNDSKLEPTHSNAFCPHEAGAYYLAKVETVATIRLFAKVVERPVYTYGITTINFEQDADTGKWVWFDGEQKLSQRCRG